MSEEFKIRRGWLIGMYILTIVHAGGSGLGMILMPDTIRSIFGWPSQNPITFGICGSVWLAFGLLSILGLRSLVKFSPLLLLQLCYKIIWFIGVLLPFLVTHTFQSYMVGYVVFFAIYIIGDLIAIPFSYVFKK
jgi:hypothetical protein